MSVEGVTFGQDLRSLELDAYTKVVRCFMQGPYDLAKEEALATLRQALHISNDDHLRVRMDLRAEQQQQGGAKRAPQLQPASSAPPSPSFALSSHPSGASPQLHPQQASRQLPAGGKGGSGSSRAAGAAGGSASRKRLKGEGGNTAKPPRQRGSAAVPAAAQLGDIDPLVGRKVMRYWPRDGGWFNGIISDYSRATGEHCIVYDFGLPSESYEWFAVEAAVPEEFQLLQGRADIASLPGIQAQQPAAAAARKAPAAQQGQQRAAGTAAAGAAGRGGGWLPGQARAAGQQQQQQQRGATGGYRLAGASKAGQRLPVATRPRLSQDWSSEEEEEGGSDQEWGPRHRDASAAYSDASD